jgi:hypothetical protein
VVHCSKLSWTSEHPDSIGACHMVHHHGAPLNICESFESFKMVKKFGLHCSRIQGTPHIIKVVRNESRGEVIKALGCAPGIASGRSQR